MKKLISLITILLVLFVLVPSKEAAVNVPMTHSFYEEMAYLVNKGIMQGEADGSIHPDRTITRAEAAVMIGRLKGFDDTQKTTPFSDVAKDHFASGYIAEAVKAGYLHGYPNHTFEPKAPIIRGDMAMVLARVFDLGLGFQNGFKDVSPNMKAYESVNHIIAANITVGYPDNTFRPLVHVTRGQFAAFLARGLEPKFKNDAVIPGSYMKNKTKTYTYRMGDGSTAVHRFVNVPDKGGLAFGFMWTVHVGGKVEEYVELENYRFFAFGWPYSEYYVALVYPVAAGKKFNTFSDEAHDIYTITAVNKTVKTRYKTFTNATEILVPDGTRYYMVPGHSTVKTVNPQGKVIYELISVK